MSFAVPPTILDLKQDPRRHAASVPSQSFHQPCGTFPQPQGTSVQAQQGIFPQQPQQQYGRMTTQPCGGPSPRAQTANFSPNPNHVQRPVPPPSENLQIDLFPAKKPNSKKKLGEDAGIGNNTSGNSEYTTSSLSQNTTAAATSYGENPLTHSTSIIRSDMSIQNRSAVQPISSKSSDNPSTVRSQKNSQYKSQSGKNFNASAETKLQNLVFSSDLERNDQENSNSIPADNSYNSNDDSYKSGKNSYKSGDKIFNSASFESPSLEAPQQSSSGFFSQVSKWFGVASSSNQQVQNVSSQQTECASNTQAASSNSHQTDEQPDQQGTQQQWSKAQVSPDFGNNPPAGVHPALVIPGIGVVGSNSSSSYVANSNAAFVLEQQRKNASGLIPRSSPGPGSLPRSSQPGAIASSEPKAFTPLVSVSQNNSGLSRPIPKLGVNTPGGSDGSVFPPTTPARTGNHSGGGTGNQAAGRNHAHLAAAGLLGSPDADITFGNSLGESPKTVFGESFPAGALNASNQTNLNTTSMIRNLYHHGDASYNESERDFNQSYMAHTLNAALRRTGSDGQNENGGPNGSTSSITAGENSSSNPNGNRGQNGNNGNGENGNGKDMKDANYWKRNSRRWQAAFKSLSIEKAAVDERGENLDKQLQSLHEFNERLRSQLAEKTQQLAEKERISANQSDEIERVRKERLSALRMLDGQSHEDLHARILVLQQQNDMLNEELKAKSQQVEASQDVAKLLYTENTKLHHIAKEREAQITKIEREDGMCSICMENLSNTVLLPCKHLCICESCWTRNFKISECHGCIKDAEYIDCPICREPIREGIVTFLQ